MEVEGKTKIHEGLITYEIGDKKFELRELKIKKTKELAEKLSIIHSDLQKYLKDKKENEDVELLDPMFLEGARNAVALTISLLLGAEEIFSADWLEENATYTLIEDVVKEASVMSRLDWLPPFFGAFFQTANSIVTFLRKRDVPSGNPTT